MLRLLPILFAFLIATGCAAAPGSPPLTPDPELNTFVREVERHLEAHAWQEVLAAADPDHRRTQVVEGGMGEAQYVAELFGLHRVDNNIKRGERVEWADLERIRSVRLGSLDPEGPPHALRGTVELRDGSTLRLRALVDRRDGRYVLTGGVG